MKSTPKWLLIPPAVAILLILGPLSMQGEDPSAQSPTAGPAAPAPAAEAGKRKAIEPSGPPEARASSGSLVPRTPDMWKMSSALIGVLLLGVGGVIVLKRLRGGATPTGNTALATLRQTVRLSQRQSLHAVEFDNRILLIGEHERGLVLLDRGGLPDSASDEAEVLARHRQVLDDDADDDGAVPKNLLIPRPEGQPRPQRRPTQPAVANLGGVSTTRLNDFRNLLQKVGR